MKFYMTFCLSVLICRANARVIGQPSDDYINPAPDSIQLANYSPKHHKYEPLSKSSFAYNSHIIETIKPSINLISFSIPQKAQSNQNYGPSQQLLSYETSHTQYTHPKQPHPLQLFVAPYTGGSLRNNNHYHSIPIQESIPIPAKQTIQRDYATALEQTHQIATNLQNFLSKPKETFTVLPAGVPNTEQSTALVHQGKKALSTETLSVITPPAINSESYHYKLLKSTAAVSSAPPRHQLFITPVTGIDHESNTALRASYSPKQTGRFNYEIPHIQSNPSTYFLNTGSGRQIHDVNAVTSFQPIQTASDNTLQQTYNEFITSPRKQDGLLIIPNTPISAKSSYSTPLQQTLQLPLAIPFETDVKNANSEPYAQFLSSTGSHDFGHQSSL